MSRRTLTIVVAIGVLLAATVVATDAEVRLWGDHTGYEPEQPIAFSHRLHAGELAIDCRYCHHGAERSKHAGIPAADLCMNCHAFVHAPWDAVRAEQDAARAEGRPAKEVRSAEIAKVHRALASGEAPRWERVHKLPDHVFFDHRAHTAARVACSACHGPVETMERVRQVASLSMGWCIDCHRGGPTALDAGLREVRASTDCMSCHY